MNDYFSLRIGDLVLYESEVYKISDIDLNCGAAGHVTFVRVNGNGGIHTDLPRACRYKLDMLRQGAKHIPRRKRTTSIGIYR